MPTYKNVTTVRKDLNGKVIEPGHSVCSVISYDPNTVGLLKTSDKPYYNPIIISEKIESPREIKIPKIDNIGLPLIKYNIHYSVEKGDVFIKYNDKNNNPPLVLYPNARWNHRCLERYVDEIIVEGEPGFILYLIVEKVC